jgi:DNA mismatch repair protein MutS
VQVAKLAGLPPSVIGRAQTVLETLETVEREGPKRTTLIDDLPLFSVRPEPPKPSAPPSSPLETILRQTHPDMLSPKDALDLVYRLRDLLDAAPDDTPSGRGR